MMGSMLSLLVYIAVIWLDVSGGMDGFQLEDLSISQAINHVTCYELDRSHWWKIYLKKKWFTILAFQSECCNFNQ